jgi:head-tail adaptor
MTDNISLDHLRERVTLEGTIYTAGPGGSQNRLPAVLGIVWAHITPMKSDTIVVAGQQRRTVTYKVIVRNQDQLGNVDRLLWREKTLRVTGLTPHARRGFMIFYCESDTVV